MRGLNIWKALFRDVHNVTGMMKLWLRSVPDGIIPYARYDDFIFAGGPSLFASIRGVGQGLTGLCDQASRAKRREYCGSRSWSPRCPSQSPLVVSSSRIGEAHVPSSRILLRRVAQHFNA